MRSGLANGTLHVGSVDAIALQAQSYPARAQRIVFSWRDLLVAMAVGWVLGVIDDHKVAIGARRALRAHRDGVVLQHLAVVDDRQLPVCNADNNLPLACRCN